MDKTNFVDVLEAVAVKADIANQPEAEDYWDDDGYLVCGKCHTRREIDIDIASEGGITVERRVRVLCDCRKEAEEQAEREERKKRELEMVSYLKEQSLMDSRLESATFDSFIETDKNKRNLKLCRRYVENFDEMVKKNQGLLFYGGVGTGKTYAAACIANRLLEARVPVVMTSFIKLLSAVTGRFDDDNTVIRRLNRAKLLIVDDLGAERGTEFAVEKVYDIIDSRYRASLPMILTTNLSLEEMKKPDNLHYARIFDRIFEMCYPVQFTGRSWRRAEAARRFDEMEKFMEGD